MAPTAIDDSNPYKKEYTNKRKKPNETESPSEIYEPSATKKQDALLSEEKKSKIFAKKPEIDDIGITSNSEACTDPNTTGGDLQLDVS